MAWIYIHFRVVVLSDGSHLFFFSSAFILFTMRCISASRYATLFFHSPLSCELMAFLPAMRCNLLNSSATSVVTYSLPFIPLHQAMEPLPCCKAHRRPVSVSCACLIRLSSASQASRRTCSSCCGSCCHCMMAVFTRSLPLTTSRAMASEYSAATVSMASSWALASLVGSA